jgi:drug/metabolite transporter (DMT)-like permease
MKFSWPIHLSFIAQGFFLFSIPYIACYAAGQYIPSGLNAIGFSTVLIFNIINSLIFYRIPLTLPIICGALCGTGGVVTTFWPSVSALDGSNESLLGILLSLTAGMLASFGNMVSVRNQKKNISVIESNAYAMGYGALIMLGVIFFKGVPFQFDISYSYVVSLLHLSIFGSVIAFGSYLTLLGRIGPTKAGYASLAVPVVALGISAFFENFVWDLHTFLGVGLIIFGNIIILARKSAPQTKAIEEAKSLTSPLLQKAA